MAEFIGLPPAKGYKKIKLIKVEKAPGDRGFSFEIVLAIQKILFDPLTYLSYNPSKTKKPR